MQRTCWMTTLPVLSLLLLLNDSFCNDTPFVINRITNRIEFSELLLGYNYNYAANRNVEVMISFIIRHVLIHRDTISLSCEIFQKWRDSRLKYSGIKSITIPKNIEIWKPDTSFLDTTIMYSAESLRLYSNGIVCWKQRVILTFPCASSDFVFKQSDLSTLDCSLIIGSFDNSGAESIIYRVSDIMLPSNLNRSYANLMMNYTITTFEDVAPNGESMIQTVIHFLIESDLIVRFSNETNFNRIV
ncbi:Gamma-aminobutyric acid receptor alpha-like [Dirofilaria immitis]